MDGAPDDVAVVIRDPTGAPAGLGVLVDRVRVLTCAHVVERALAPAADLTEQTTSAPDAQGPDAQGPDDGGGSGRRVRVEVMRRGQDGDCSLLDVVALVSGWDPPDGGDLAVLTLPGPVPDDVRPARLVGPGVAVSGWPQPLRVFGYPAGRPRGQWTEVRAVGVVGGGRVQLNTVHGALPSVRAGYSGSPVHDPRTGEVVAVVTEAPSAGLSHESLAIPASTIRAFLASSAGGAPAAPAEAGAAGSGPEDPRRGGCDAARRRPARAYAPAEELTVLHLSDLRFGSEQTAPPLDLTGQDLRDQDISALTFGRPGNRGLAGAALRNTTWTGTRLAWTRLAGADLTGADLRDVDFVDVDLSRARLVGASLNDARLTRVNLTDADLTGADLSRARLTDVDLSGATVVGCRWTRTAVLGGRQPVTVGATAWAQAAVPGHDPASAVLASGTMIRCVTGIPGTDLLAAAHGHTIQLIDLHAHRCLATLTGHIDQVVSVTAVGLADGRTLLASGGNDGSVRLWDPATGTAVGKPLTGHTHQVTSMTAVGLADGRTLLATGGNDGVRLWDPATGTAVGKPLTVPTCRTWPVMAVTTVRLADGRTLLATGRNGSVWLLDPATGTTVGDPLPGDIHQVVSVTAVGLADGRTLLATGYSDGSVRLWDPVTGKRVRKSLTGYTGRVLSVAAVGLVDGRTLLASGSDDGSVRLWDPVTGTAVGDPLPGHTSTVWSLAAVGLVDGRTLLASGSDDGSVRLWDPATGTAVGKPLTGHTGPVTAVRLADERTLLASGSDDGSVRLWDPVTGTQVGQALTGHTGRVWSVAAVGLADGRTLLASGSRDGSVRLWDPATGKEVGKALVGLVSSVTAVGLADGRTLLATGGNGSVWLWDPATGTAVGKLLTGHTGAVVSLTAVRLADGRTLLATGSSDGLVRLWRFNARDPERRAPALAPATVPSTWLSKVRRALEALPTAKTVPVPEVDLEHLATLIAGPSGWAMLAADGRSYKVGGDAGDLLWWVIKTVRFEVGELDPYDSTIRRLDHDAAVV